MSTGISFADLNEFLDYSLPRATIVKLQAIIQHINQTSTSAVKLPKQGRKADLLASIAHTLKSYQVKGDLLRYQQVRQLYNDLMRPTQYPHPNSYSPTPGMVNPHAYNSPGPSWQTNPATGAPYVASGGPSTPARLPTGPKSVVGPPMLVWKTTPAWKAIKAVSDLSTIPAIEEGHTHEKKSRALNFACSPEILDQIKIGTADSPVRKALRLFCTSSEYYPSYQQTGVAIPIEFPHSYEVTLNSTLLKVQKGLKGKANTVPPSDLMQARAMKQVPNMYNMLSLTHVGPSMSKKTKQPKKFFMQVCLTEVTSTNEMKRQITSRRKTKEDTVQTMKSKSAEDDIEVGSTRLSLKCPLSYIRISNPMRSDHCTHVQCCDLDSWMMINESTPSWTCPSCEQELALDKIFIDEFFLSILSACPDSIDEVFLEADGEWHSEDGKYASAEWKAANPLPLPNPRLLAGSSRPSRTATPEVKPKPESPSATEGVSSRGTEPPPSRRIEPEVFVLEDSDDEDMSVSVPAPSTRNETAYTNGNGRPAPLDLGSSMPPESSVEPLSAQTNGGPPADSGGVIDLCDSSDEEDDEPLAVTMSARMPDSRIHGSNEEENGTGPSYLGKRGRTASDEDSRYNEATVRQRRRVTSPGTDARNAAISAMVEDFRPLSSPSTREHFQVDQQLPRKDSVETDGRYTPVSNPYLSSPPHRPRGPGENPWPLPTEPSSRAGSASLPPPPLNHYTSNLPIPNTRPWSPTRSSASDHAQSHNHNVDAQERNMSETPNPQPAGQNGQTSANRPYSSPALPPSYSKP